MFTRKSAIPVAVDTLTYAVGIVKDSMHRTTHHRVQREDVVGARFS